MTICEDSFIYLFLNKIDWIFELDIMHNEQIMLFRALINETQKYLHLSKPFIKSVKNFLNVNT